MRSPSDQSQSRRILLIVAPLATVMITPWMSYDPINIPKMGVIVVCAFILLALGLQNFRVWIQPRYRLIVAASTFFGFDLLLVLLIKASPLEEHFFGTYGRNTGFLAYLSLLILFATSATALDLNTVERLLWILVGTGGISAIYGFLQSLRLDPFHWVNPYSPVFGFLGNPDFLSTFLGMCGIAAAALLALEGQSRKLRGVLGVYLAFIVYIVVKTQAQQGFFVLAAGIAVVLYLYMLKNKRFRRFHIPYLILSAIATALVALGSLSKGPLAHHLYKLSVTYRGDYWRAGWKMTIQHPLTGVGLDSYGDWYRASRTLAATLRRGPDLVSNAAHNVLLDFSSNGGFPLLIAYLLIVGLSLRSAIRVIRRNQGFNAIHAGIFGVWVGYQAQTLISVNQLGLAVWGWIFSGALIAYDINSRPSEEVTGYSKRKAKRSKGRNVKVETSSSATSLVVFAGLAVGLALALPPFITDAKFREGLLSGSAQDLKAGAIRWPVDAYRMTQAVQVMDRSKLPTWALDLAEIAAKQNPRAFDAWREIYFNAGSNLSEKADALRHMKILDPHNPILK